MENRCGVDIIIPVYNALEELKVCIDSIQRHTDLTLDRLVIVNDNSPDTEVAPYLKAVSDGNQIVVLENEQNLGFSGSVNRGITYSNRDVLLLNSDTVVTARWLDKIVHCAYSDPAISTVTPFSNNATLCSVPEFCKDNTIPYNLTIDKYADAVYKSIRL